MSSKYADHPGYRELLGFLRGIPGAVEVDADGQPTYAQVESVREHLKQVGYRGSRRRRWIAAALAELGAA